MVLQLYFTTDLYELLFLFTSVALNSIIHQFTQKRAHTVRVFRYSSMFFGETYANVRYLGSTVKSEALHCCGKLI